MSEIIQYSRLQCHRWTTPGTVPTIPSTDDVTSDLFLATDLKNGEFAINIPDQKAWFRAGSTIVELVTIGAVPVSDLESVLGEGNTTGAFDILVDSGQAIIFADETTIGYRTGSIGTASVIIGGLSGTGLTASADNTFATGDNSSASGAFAIVMGQDAVASGAHSFSQGNTSIASGNKAFASGGHSTASHYGEQSRGVFFFASAADAQHGSVNYGYKTTGSTPTELFLDGIGGTERFTIPSNSSYAVEIRCIASDNTTGDSAMFTGKGLVKNVAGTVSIVGAITLTQDAADASMVTTALTATAVSNYLELKGTGVLATNVLWNATCNYTKVAY